MSLWLRVSQRIDAANETIGRFLSWFILAAVVISAGNALVRKIFSTSSNAWLELQWYLFGAVFLGCAAWTLKSKEHIRIDVVYGHLSRRTQHWIDLLGHVLFLMPFCALMIWLAVPYALSSIRSGEISTNAGGLILWPAKLMVLLAFLMLFAQGISEIIKKIAVMRGLLPDLDAASGKHESAEAEALRLKQELEAIVAAREAATTRDSAAQKSKGGQS